MVIAVYTAYVHYQLAHYPSIPHEKVDVNPKSIELSGLHLSVNERNILRRKYQVLESQTVFVYGANQGKPQGIDYLKQVFQDNLDNKNAFLSSFAPGKIITG